MRAVVIGTGTIGSAVRTVLETHGHAVVSVGRTFGDFHADIADPASLRTVFARIGRLDAVANAAGDVFPGPFEELTDDQWTKSIDAKGMGQIHLVRAALPHISDRGSFTLISGVLTDERIYGGAIGTTVNHLVEGFVKAAAAELPRGLRINCVSPTVLVESPQYRAFMPGFSPVHVSEVALAYLRAMSNPITGRILKLYKTDC